MNYFLTGATGYIGTELTKQLLEKGDTVHALVRSPQKTRFSKSQNLRIFAGDISNKSIIINGMNGCDYVFHLAGYTKPWSKDKNLPVKINIEGTRNVLESALKNKVKRVVYTSTAGTLMPSETDEEIDETSKKPLAYLTDYEQTKREAEKLCLEYIKKGLDVVIVSPSRIYGPGLLNKSNSVTIIVKQFNNGKWHILPGNGKTIANYVFIKDVINGHLLTLQKGKTGENYILGGTNVSYEAFFNTLLQKTNKKQTLFKLPLWLMIMVSRIIMIPTLVFHNEPLITPQWVKRYNQNRVLSSNKAINELGYSITPLNKGISLTLEWLNTKPTK